MWWVAAALAFSVGDRSWGPEYRPIVWHVIEEGELACPLADESCVEGLEAAFDAWAEASGGATRHSYGGPCTEADLDNVDVKDVGRWEAGMLSHIRSKHQGLLDFITDEDPKIKGDAEDKIKAALDEYAATFA